MEKMGWGKFNMDEMYPYRKIVSLLEKGGYGISYYDSTIKKDGRLVGSFDTEGVVDLKYTPDLERLPLLFGLHDFCFKKGIVHRVSDLKKTRNTLIERVLATEDVIKKLNSKMGYDK